MDTWGDSLLYSVGLGPAVKYHNSHGRRTEVTTQYSRPLDKSHRKIELLRSGHLKFALWSVLQFHSPFQFSDILEMTTESHLVLNFFTSIDLSEIS
jgi:hypothetical protein